MYFGLCLKKNKLCILYEANNTNIHHYQENNDVIIYKTQDSPTMNVVYSKYFNVDIGEIRVYNTLNDLIRFENSLSEVIE